MPLFPKEPLKLREEFSWKNFRVQCSCSEAFCCLQWTENNCLYFAYRLLIFAYCLGWAIADLITTRDPLYYAYFSHWMELVECLYFGFMFGLATHNFFSRKNESRMNGSLKNDASTRDGSHGRGSHLGWREQTAWILFNICASSTLGVCIIYWTGRSQQLVEPSISLHSVNIHVHVICTVLFLVEVCLVSFPVRLLHFYIPFTFDVIYTVFMLLLHASDVTSSIYKVVDWANKPELATAVVLIIIVLGVPFLHSVTYVLYRARCLVARRLLLATDGGEQAKVGADDDGESIKMTTCGVDGDHVVCEITPAVDVADRGSGSSAQLESHTMTDA